MEGIEISAPRPSCRDGYHLGRRVMDDVEPPRKRHHADMDVDDWGVGSIAKSSTNHASPLSFSNNMFTRQPVASTSALPSPYTRSSTSSAPAPFLFHAASVFDSDSMDVDDAAAHAPLSRAAAHAESLKSNLTQYREISHGAQVREKRQRDKLKNWQIAKATVSPDSDDEQQSRDDSVTSTSGFGEQARQLFRRRKRDPHSPHTTQLSLHSHNYHFASPNTGEGFTFGQGAPLSASSQIANYAGHAGHAGMQQYQSDTIWQRKSTPHLLLSYLQLIFNAALGLVALFLLISFLLMLRTDMRERRHEASIELHQSILHCSQAYMQNRCPPETRVPAMDKACREWEYCMNRNPNVVGAARLGAEILAEVFNGFVETVSWRTMLFLLALLAMLLAFMLRYRRPPPDRQTLGDKHHVPYQQETHRLEKASQTK